MLRQSPMTGERRDVSKRQVSNQQNVDEALGTIDDWQTPDPDVIRLADDVGVARHGLAHPDARILPVLVGCGLSPP